MQVSSPIPKKHARIEIIPLIDIMFFLLASFMMVSLSQTHMKGIRVALPSQVQPPPQTTGQGVSIRVGAGDAVTFDGQYVPRNRCCRDFSNFIKPIPALKSQSAPRAWPDTEM